MSDELILDFGDGGRVSVALRSDRRSGGEPASKPYEVTWPLDAAASQDLRWYLEDYLSAPYGVYGERGPAAADRLAGWGAEVFTALFGRGPGRDAYRMARARDPAGTLVVMRSGSPEVLGLPWELLRDPERTAPLALDLAGVSRSLPEGFQEPFAVSGERLRVLMVICRPRGNADVGYRMIARPLLERLALVCGRVDLVVLRPPTLAALRSTLAEAAAGERFQVVHFDGHGALVDRERLRGTGRGRSDPSGGRGGEGVLVFEAPGGGRDDVPAEVFAHVLAAAKVPLVVLNACESGAVGKRLEAAIATRLMQAGAASVVAMAYRVDVVAAAEFMAALYERLFAGEGVTEAVRAGRRRLYDHDERPSPKGPMALADWLVPVHYMHRDVRFPDLLVAPDRPASLDSGLDRLRQGPTTASPDPALEPVGVFVGRDVLFYDLEVVTRRQRVVLLHGSGGSGKTELAKAFGRWWADTAGVESPHWVIMHSFEPGVASFGLDGLITAVGLRVFGVDFARLATAERRTLVERLLNDRRLLLILDNFESVADMPDPTAATPPLDAAGREELRAFLAGAAGGNSAVIITSRSPEAWLGEIGRIEVGGLSVGETIEYAQQLLAPFPAAGPRRANRAFAELLECLDGHPLAMRLVLPYLDTTEPETLLAALAGAGDLPGVAGGNPKTSLAASVAYSFDHLTPTAGRLLVVLCLSHGVVDASALSLFSQEPEAPGRFRGTTRPQWGEVLDAAADVGLLTRLGGSLYRVHPALPAFLAARWRDEAPEDHEDQRRAAIGGLLAAYALLSRWLLSQARGGDAGTVHGVTGHLRRTLEAFLGLALDTRRWEDAKAILALLDEYWAVHGYAQETQAWTTRAQAALENPDGKPQSLDSPAGKLWLSLVCSPAKRDSFGVAPDDAERSYRVALDLLGAQPASHEQLRQLAIVHFLLGTVAERRGRPDEAEDWYRKSLAIEPDAGDRPVTSQIYEHLGFLAQHRGRLAEAEGWTRKSLAIREDVGDRTGMAANYHNLGYIAHDRGRLDEADDWYRKSLAIAADAGDRPSMAGTYHHLGMVAQDRGRPEQAEQWYHLSLVTSEILGLRPLNAATYHQLGMVAYHRGRLDEADDWNRKSLAQSQALGDRAGVATSYNQLAMVVHHRGQLDEAEDWYRKALAIKEDLGDRAGVADAFHNIGAIAQDRGDLAGAEDWFRQSLAVNEDLGNRATVAATLQRLGSVAHAGGRLAEAEDWYRRSLAVNEEYGNLSAMVGLHRNLGVVSFQRGQLIEADGWYRKSLVGEEDLGGEADVASTYHDLGAVAQGRGQLGEAEHWYRRWLAVNEEMGDRPGMAAGCLALGAVAQGRGQLGEAEDWYRTSLALHEDLGDRAGMASCYRKLGVVAAELGRLDGGDG